MISLHTLHRTLAPHRMHCTALQTCIVWFTLFALFICMHRTACTYRSIRTACIIIRTGRIVCIVCLVCTNCVFSTVRASLTVCNGYIVNVICIYACMHVSQCTYALYCISLFTFYAWFCMVSYHDMVCVVLHHLHRLHGFIP